jgi:uncharacterized membrane protein
MFRTLLTVTWLIWAGWILLWGICVVKAFGGRRWKLPLAGAYAERFSARPPA